MSGERPALFRGRHFADEIIVLCVPWYLRYFTQLSGSDRNNARAGRWTYLYRAVDSTGATVDFLLSEARDLSAARTFFQKALAAPGHPALKSRARQSENRLPPKEPAPPSSVLLRLLALP
jgi:hypothetical protein